MELKAATIGTSSAPGGMAPSTEIELAEYLSECHAHAVTLRVAGGATRSRPATTAETVLTTSMLDGIVAYEPGELTLIAKSGTPVETIERALAAEGQAFAFEPMDHRLLLGSTGTPTIGGMVAANVSGPRRVRAGACRDHLLGVRFVDGRGRIIKNGGRVMKNVTGMDLGKLLCGSYGALGVLTEIAIKTLPVAESQNTIAFGGISPREAVKIFSSALATPFEVSGAAFHDGTAWLRIEGLARQVDHRREKLSALFKGNDHVVLSDEESRLLWLSLRDLHHFTKGNDAVWRILVKPTDAPTVLEALKPFGGDASLDWGGGAIWYSGNLDAAGMLAYAPSGLATLVRPGPIVNVHVSPVEAPGVAALTAALRRTFDPAGILNPGLMVE